MPGVMVIEALAQISGLLAYASGDAKPGGKSLIFFAGIDKRAVQAASGTRRSADPGIRSDPRRPRRRQVSRAGNGRRRDRM